MLYRQSPFSAEGWSLDVGGIWSAMCTMDWTPPLSEDIEYREFSLKAFWAFGSRMQGVGCSVARIFKTTLGPFYLTFSSVSNPRLKLPRPKPLKQPTRCCGT